MKINEITFQSREEAHRTTSAPVINYLANTIFAQAAAVFEFDPELHRQNDNPTISNKVTQVACQAEKIADIIKDESEHIFSELHSFNQYLNPHRNGGPKINNERNSAHFTSMLSALLDEGIGTGITMSASLANIYLSANEGARIEDAAEFLRTRRAAAWLLGLSNTSNGLFGSRSNNPAFSSTGRISFHDPYVPESLSTFRDHFKGKITRISDGVPVLTKEVRKYLKAEKDNPQSFANTSASTDGCPARKSRFELSEIAIQTAYDLCIEPSDLEMQPSAIKTAAEYFADCLDVSRSTVAS